MICGGTGYSYVVSEEDAKQEGVRAFLMKPVVMEQLAHTIRAELEIPPEESPLLPRRSIELRPVFPGGTVSFRIGFRI